MRKELESLFKSLKTLISEDTLVETGDGYRKGLDVTVGFTVEDSGEISWDYQTGDNSFSGAAYGHPHWVTTTLFPQPNSQELAKEVLDQILEVTRR
jgi:hypothetical protein